MDSLWVPITAVFAFAIIPVTVWAALRRKRRPVVLLIAEATKVGIASSNPRLGMTWDKHPIEHPWLVTVTVANDSRDDIDSARFDRGRPLTLTMGNAQIKDSLQGSLRGAPWAVSNEGAIEFQPDLIHAKSELEIQLVVDGAPTLKWLDPPLINVEVRYSRSDWEPWWRNRDWLIVGIGIAGLVVAGAGVAITASNRDPAPLPVIVPPTVTVTVTSPPSEPTVRPS